MKLILVFSVVFALAQCVPVDNEETVARLFVGNFVNCMNSDMSLCLKEHALKAAERLRTLRSLKLTDNLSFLNHANVKEGRSLEPLSTEPEVRKQQVSQRLWDTTSDILRNSELEYTIADDEEASTSVAEAEEGRGKKKEKKKKIKMLIPFLILAKIKAIIIAVASLKIIALSLWKLAVLAKIVFLAKLFGILKALLAKKHDNDDHGWATVHHDEHSHHGGGGGWDSGAGAGWSRSSRNDALSMAYAAQQQ